MLSESGFIKNFINSHIQDFGCDIRCNFDTYNWSGVYNNIGFVCFQSLKSVFEFELFKIFNYCAKFLPPLIFEEMFKRSYSKCNLGKGSAAFFKCGLFAVFFSVFVILDTFCCCNIILICFVCFWLNIMNILLFWFSFPLLGNFSL